MGEERGGEREAAVISPSPYPGTVPVPGNNAARDASGGRLQWREKGDYGDRGAFGLLRGCVNGMDALSSGK